jgi:hypothetical protein
MIKKLYVAVGLSAMCLVSTTVYSRDENSRDENTWELPNDVLGTSNQISFNQGANGVWYFMESNSLVHDPLTYRFLPNFTAPCSWGTLGVQTGLACWADASDAFHISNFEDPKIILNASSQSQSFYGLNILPNTLAQEPGPFQLAIVAWQSPVDSNVKVVGTFTALESCANGVLWSVDKGSTTLNSGMLLSGSASFTLPTVGVKNGEVLYFTLDPNGNFNCDTTALQVSIVGQPRPSGPSSNPPPPGR